MSNRLSVLRTHRLVAALMLMLAGGGQAAISIRLDGDRVIVTTERIELVMQRGAVTGLRDLTTGEPFALATRDAAVETVPSGVALAENSWAFREAWYRGGPARCASDKKLQELRRRPAAGSPPAFTRISPVEAEVVYSGLTRGAAGDAIRYRIVIDTNTHEVLLSGETRLSGTNAPPRSLDLAFLNLKSAAVILGCGTRIEAGHPGRRVDTCNRWANNLASPNCAILEGRRGVASLFPESVDAYVNILLAHDPGSDDAVVYTAGRDARHGPDEIRSAPLRIGVHANWVEAARRYRERFEELTGARPLWEQTPLWVRKIHAVHTGAPGGNHGNPPQQETEAYYDRLAGAIDPAALLLFYWNGNGIVQFGDHRYFTRLGWPKPHVVAALKQRGFRWIGYHPYTLFRTAAGMREWLGRAALANYGMPEGYTFQPDYGGPPDFESFYTHFLPVSAETEEHLIYHPGSLKGRQYFVRNFGNYCKFHNMDGNYLDICGADHDHRFPSGKKVQEGMTYRMGEACLLREAKEKLPELAMMSEVQSAWTVAHTFYTWEGSSHYWHARTYASNDSIVNHPLRTALWGSYCWTQETELEPDESALMGGLPELRLDDPWSIARCRLHAGEELFHGLPESWEPDVLACYRAKGNRRFEYRRLPWGDGYVELTAKGRVARLGRFSGVSESPLPGPVWIPGWPAWSAPGRPIGLDPDRVYPFISATNAPGGDFNIGSLPPGVSVRAVRRDAKAWHTVEFGTRGGELRQSGIILAFHRRCLRVCDAEREHFGPFEAGTATNFVTRAPGGLVLVWDEPSASRGQARNNLLAAKGRLNAMGLHDPRFAFNASLRVTERQIGDETMAAIEVGPGRYRGYTEGWVGLHPDSDPALRFAIGYPKADGHRVLRPRAYSVQVNGREIWREHIAATNRWLPREVPLAAYRGRAVLLTLSVEETGSRNVFPSHEDPPALFGNVHVDHNPISLGPLDGAPLPRPARVLFEGFGATNGIAAPWRAFNSPSNIQKGLLPSVTNGVLLLAGQHYKHQYLARPLPATNVAVQARIQTPLTGSSREWNPGLGLYWGTGCYAFITAGGYTDTGTQIAIRGEGRRLIPLKDHNLRITDDNRCDFWVRIEADERTIRYATALDGRTWTTACETPRPKAAAGAPWLLAGRGWEGPNDVFQNDMRHDGGSSPAVISDLVVGR